MKALERFDTVSVVGGLLCYVFAMSLLVIAPYALTNADEAKVVDIHGNVVDVPEYTQAELRGRQIYMDQVCWHCHSQFVRPVNDERARWGPVSQPGESVNDTPHLYSTRRIGPDLAREGWRRVDDWQYAHLYNPRYTISSSVMPAFTWLFRDYEWRDEVVQLIEDYDTNRDGVINIELDNQANLWTPSEIERLKRDLLSPGSIPADSWSRTWDSSPMARC